MYFIIFFLCFILSSVSNASLTREDFKNEEGWKKYQIKKIEKTNLDNRLQFLEEKADNAMKETIHLKLENKRQEKNFQEAFDANEEKWMTQYARDTTQLKSRLFLLENAVQNQDEDSLFYQLQSEIIQRQRYQEENSYLTGILDFFKDKVLSMADKYIRIRTAPDLGSRMNWPQVAQELDLPEEEVKAFGYGRGKIVPIQDFIEREMSKKLEEERIKKEEMMRESERQRQDDLDRFLLPITRHPGHRDHYASTWGNLGWVRERFRGSHLTEEDFYKQAMGGLHSERYITDYLSYFFLPIQHWHSRLECHEKYNMTWGNLSWIKEQYDSDIFHVGNDPDSFYERAMGRKKPLIPFKEFLEIPNHALTPHWWYFYT